MRALGATFSYNIRDRPGNLWKKSVEFGSIFKEIKWLICFCQGRVMSRLLIDGYNLLHTTSKGGSPGDEDVEDLIESLRKYKHLKGHAITVVFDGHQGGMPIEGKSRIKGIGVVYSSLGEKADQVIERFVRNEGGSSIVVTSDRALADSVERDGAAVIGSTEFWERLQMAEYLALKGSSETDESGKIGIHTRKKGNPKRKSKKERARRRRLRKL